MTTALIIGGGLSGLAAAAALSTRNFQVTLVESRPRLGGRASSFTDPKTGETIDNCQHVAMGCCTNFRAFCRMTGVEPFFRPAERLNFIGPDPGITDWSASGLPAPLHLMPAFLRLRTLTLAQKVTAARGLRALAHWRPGNRQESFADWLIQQKQPKDVIERFWEVVLVSALSESMDRIDIGYARKVFVDGFIANRHGWEVLIPTRPMDDLYTGPMSDWFRKQQVDIRLQSGVERLLSESGRITGAVLRNGEVLTADQYILTVPWDRARDLLEPVTELSAIAPLEAAPISSVHLWFDRPITDLPHAVIVGKSSQWLFQRGEDLIEGSARTSFYYQVVVSASRQFLERPTTEAIEHVRQELASLWPVAAQAQLLRGRVVTEHKAVFSPVPGIDALRPVQRTSIPNLQLAGDWTRTGWPATMEGAVRSGFLAAEQVLEQTGHPEKLVADPLPVAKLARWLIGL